MQACAGALPVGGTQCTAHTRMCRAPTACWQALAGKRAGALHVLLKLHTLSAASALHSIQRPTLRASHVDIMLLLSKCAAQMCKAEPPHFTTSTVYRSPLHTSSWSSLRSTGGIHQPLQSSGNRWLPTSHSHRAQRYVRRGENSNICAVSMSTRLCRLGFHFFNR
jgi:hypothetical protein